MPSAGFPTAHSSTSSIFPSGPKSGTSIFDAWSSRSSKKTAPHVPTASTQPNDSASIRSSNTCTSTSTGSTASVLYKQKAHAQAASQPRTLNFLTVATKGFDRSFPKYK